MQYRRFGALGWQVSALGFGAMRLPTLGQPDAIDEPEAIRMLRYAIDHGVNYVDTAYPYHGGKGERVVGLALQDGYRERVHLATKLPVMRVTCADDFDRFLDEQLERLRVSYLDLYLFHGLRRARWEIVEHFGLLARAERALADGRIHHLGFSFHDSLELFEQIIDGYDNWSMCQIQYNYMNETEQAGTEGLRYAAARGLAVAVMEPLLGGRLANPPAAVQRIWDEAPVRRSPAEWALQWVWNQPEVSVVLSGMSTMAQVEENVAAAERSAVGALSAEELAIVGRVRDAYAGLAPIPCTRCGYCMPCPNGVDIPTNFNIYNEGHMYAEPERARWRYQRLAETARASACIACRQCEEQCPQHIPISEWMPTVDEVLAGVAEWAGAPR